MERSKPNGLYEDSGSINQDSFAILEPLLSNLAAFPFGGSAYYVIKTLQGVIAAAPREALLLGATAIQNAGQSITREGLAQDDVQAFVMRYVREHRGLLEADRDCLAAVMDVVDAFVDAGWPGWIDVVFELDHIYRE
jgi:hypothetical protein